jgi:hypothetical protein
MASSGRIQSPDIECRHIGTVIAGKGHKCERSFFFVPWIPKNARRVSNAIGGPVKAPLILSLLILAACPDPDMDSDTDPGTDTDVDSGTTEPLDPPEGDAATVELSGDCALAEHYGAFTISDFETYTIVDGAVANAVVPVTITPEVSAEGDCRLLVRENPFCEGGCAQDETCDFDGTCLPYPAAQDLGQVTVAGLIEDVRMDPVQPGFRYFNTSLPHPAFADGDLLQLRADGGDFGAFDLHGIGVAPLVVSASDWVITAGEDMPVTWTPAAGRAQVQLAMRMDQHGSSPATVFCDFDDDGDGTIPAHIVDDLIAAGVTGFPNGSLTRRTVDKAYAGGGCVDLITQSRRSPSVRVAGFTPCNRQEDCPDGLTCDTINQICE